MTVIAHGTASLIFRIPLRAENTEPEADEKLIEALRALLPDVTVEINQPNEMQISRPIPKRKQVQQEIDLLNKKIHEALAIARWLDLPA